MGRIFALEFQEPNYYICKNCRTDVALLRDRDSFDLTQPGFVWVIFITAVNVEVDDQIRAHGIEGEHMISDVYCIRCGNQLGFKYSTFVDGEMIKNELLQLRMSELLLMWTG